jgi:pimeloyl-ACP methyl ester carboxylesterase
VPQLTKRHLRVVAFDLLGFGNSPKPNWIDYNVDDHANAVINSIYKLRVSSPVIIVGHSMGCLVAVRIAKLRPDLVKHLVLFEMPLYEGLPHKRSYRLRTDIYYRVYRRVLKMKPTFSGEQAKLIEKLTFKIIGQEVTRATWQPFIKSLENTIMKQTTADDIKKLSIPMDVIYGRFDMVVIRGKPEHVFGVDNERIATHTVRANHVITPKASQFLVERILAAIDDN